MGLYKRGKTWWVDFTVNGRRIQQSTRTRDWNDARRAETALRKQAWTEDTLGRTSPYRWEEAVVKYLQEEKQQGVKKYLDKEIAKLRYFSAHFRGRKLSEIDRQLVDDALAPLVEEGLSNATLNRYVAVVRQILNRAEAEWEWIPRAPKLRTWRENNERVRWLTLEESDRLLAAMNPYLRRAAQFALATGLRQSNVFGLTWDHVDLQRKHAWVDKLQMKAKRAQGVPLNEDAMAALTECREHAWHPTYVFLNSRRSGPLKKINDSDWKRILRDAGIEDLRWHDLRHTWATRHVIGGTSLQELMALGGWSTYTMVLRYAHIATEQLRQAADNVNMERLRRLETEVRGLEGT